MKCIILFYSFSFAENSHNTRAKLLLNSDVNFTDAALIVFKHGSECINEGKFGITLF